MGRVRDNSAPRRVGRGAVSAPERSEGAILLTGATGYIGGKLLTVEPGVYEIAGDDAPTFDQMTAVVAELLGQPHRTVPVPVSNAAIEGAAASIVSGADRELLEPLMAGLHENLAIRRNAVRTVFGVEAAPFREAARRALEEMAADEEHVAV